MALKALEEHRGSTILRAAYADKIAEQFDVELSRQIGEVEPISNLDRIQPDNDDLGIGVGKLCMKIAEKKMGWMQKTLKPQGMEEHNV